MKFNLENYSDRVVVRVPWICSNECRSRNKVRILNPRFEFSSNLGREDFLIGLNAFRHWDFTVIVESPAFKLRSEKFLYTVKKEFVQIEFTEKIEIRNVSDESGNLIEIFIKKSSDFEAKRMENIKELVRVLEDKYVCS